ncbi:MAG: SEC-C domain-containing protein [Myxococcales bacterium]|nr:SEC-C domain-containing protein [Myxococcales bacterium]
MKCPCTSGEDYSACCEPIVKQQQKAKTAEALMRSRYTAYVRGAYTYLVATHDPATCEVDAAALAASGRRITWSGLQVLATEAGGVDDEAGVVTFCARFHDGRRAGELRERSRFRRIDGRWFYFDGSLPQAATATSTARAGAAEKVGRNAPCPCGSGRKYKRCCGADA